MKVLYTYQMDFVTPHRILFPIFFHGIDLSISDYSMSIVLLPFAVLTLMYFGVRKSLYYPRFLQNMVEFVYEKFYQIFYGYLGEKGCKYIPFLFSIMAFIFILNLGNLIPGVFACTSQLSVTLTLGFVVFVLVNVVGLMVYKSRFWLFFIPHGVPTILKPFLFVLELFSFCIRPLSLALRLAINMIAGHVLLGVVASFSPSFSAISFVSIAISAGLSIFEICVAGLQAYVFAVLSCIYIADILNGH